MTQAEAAVAVLLAHLGVECVGDIDRTPHRVVAAFRELTAGYDVDVPSLLRSFECDSDEVVVVRGIEFASMCEHHVLPFTGTASVGYVPRGRVLGLSKIPRVVQAFAARLQMQERLTSQIAQAIADSEARPLGVGVVIEATHSCCTLRGVRSSRASMVTSTMLGCFRNDPAARAELLGLIGHR